MRSYVVCFIYGINGYRRHRQASLNIVQYTSKPNARRREHKAAVYVAIKEKSTKQKTVSIFMSFYIAIHPINNDIFVDKFTYDWYTDYIFGVGSPWKHDFYSDFFKILRTLYLLCAKVKLSLSKNRNPFRT